MDRHTPEGFAFCEPVWAGPLGKWCIRKLSDAGPKYGGGVDTSSLCGRVKPPGSGGACNGWDLRVRITEGHLTKNDLICPKCLALYREATKGDST